MTYKPWEGRLSYHQAYGCTKASHRFLLDEARTYRTCAVGETLGLDDDLLDDLTVSAACNYDERLWLLGSRFTANVKNREFGAAIETLFEIRERVVEIGGPTAYLRTVAEHLRKIEEAAR